VAAGLGTPRKSMILMEDKNMEHPALIRRDECNSELSEHLIKSNKALLLGCDDISGFIVKRGSPSCANASAKLYNNKFNLLRHNADGLFVMCLREKHPYLPIEDEGRLNDLVIREHFIKQITLYHAAQTMYKSVTTTSELEAFHVQHKMLLRLHSTANLKHLGRMLANATKNDIETIKQEYFECFVQSFLTPAKPSEHYTLLQRCFRGINQHLSKTDRADIQQNLQAYLNQEVPLAVPIMLLRHYAQRYNQSFILQQSYLYPYPDGLGLMRAV
jgi:uncharacterized protein YbgA (DUF1722 family)/uncharacterized protein YbbK (DUF523 family)